MIWDGYLEGLKLVFFWEVKIFYWFENGFIIKVMENNYVYSCLNFLKRINGFWYYENKVLYICGKFF